MDTFEEIMKLPAWLRLDAMRRSSDPEVAKLYWGEFGPHVHPCLHGDHKWEHRVEFCPFPSPFDVSCEEHRTPDEYPCSIPPECVIWQGPRGSCAFTTMRGETWWWRCVKPPLKVADRVVTREEAMAWHLEHIEECQGCRTPCVGETLGLSKPEKVPDRLKEAGLEKYI